MWTLRVQFKSDFKFISALRVQKYVHLSHEFHYDDQKKPVNLCKTIAEHHSGGNKLLASRVAQLNFTIIKIFFLRIRLLSRQTFGNGFSNVSELEL